MVRRVLCEQRVSARHVISRAPREELLHFAMQERYAHVARMDRDARPSGRVENVEFIDGSGW